MKNISSREEKMIDALVSEICEGASASSNTAEPAMMIVAAPDDDRIDLRKYNAAIDALHELRETGAPHVQLAKRIEGLMDELRSNRYERFGHLIDWNTIAEGGKNDRENPMPVLSGGSSYADDAQRYAHALSEMPVLQSSD